MSEPFRFLDLPKELRLMVCEFLPITTMPLELELEDAGGESMTVDFSQNEDRDLWRTEPGRALPKVSISLRQESLSGLAILRNCRTVASEAVAILSPRLMAMRESPTTAFIVNSTTIISLELLYMFRRLVLSKCIAPKDPRPLSQARHLSDACLQVNIIINDSPADRTPTGQSMDPRDIVSLKLDLLDRLKDRLEPLYSPVRLSTAKPTRDLSVNLRTVLVSEQEKAAFE